MGRNMVYRYRPMRVVPTITTSVIMVTCSLMLGGDIMAGGKGRQLRIGINFCL